MEFTDDEVCIIGSALRQYAAARRLEVKAFRVKGATILAEEADRLAERFYGQLDDDAPSQSRGGREDFHAD